jgi:RNA polymerase sigma factor for flagellar operon FliA
MMHNHAGLAAQRSYGDDTAATVARFMPLVRKLAWHLSGSGGAIIDLEDLMQAGLVALTECVQRHQGPGWDGFVAYAKLRVRGAMVDLLRASSTDARSVRAKRRRMQEAERRLQGMLGRAPTIFELAAALDLSTEDTHALRSQVAPVAIDSIEECYSDSDTAFAADTPDAESVLLQEEDRAALVAAISGLPERLQLVVQLYFVEELNLSEIAAVLEVSVPRVHQLKASALAKLQAAMVEG